MRSREVWHHNGSEPKLCCNPIRENSLRSQPAADQRASGPFFKRTFFILSFFHIELRSKYVLFIKVTLLTKSPRRPSPRLTFCHASAPRHPAKAGTGNRGLCLELLAMLQKHRYLYSNPPEAPAPD